VNTLDLILRIICKVSGLFVNWISVYCRSSVRSRVNWEIDSCWLKVLISYMNSVIQYVIIPIIVDAVTLDIISTKLLMCISYTLTAFIRVDSCCNILSVCDVSCGVEAASLSCQLVSSFVANIVIGSGWVKPNSRCFFHVSSSMLFDKVQCIPLWQFVIATAVLESAILSCLMSIFHGYATCIFPIRCRYLFQHWNEEWFMTGQVAMCHSAHAFITIITLCTLSFLLSENMLHTVSVVTNVVILLTGGGGRGTAAAVPPPFRLSDPAFCGSRPLVTP